MTICENIKKRYIRLSKGQRKVAQYVIDNPNVVATQVASEIGRMAGVSESTVIRFCYAMSLSGFSELQEKLKQYILEKDGVIPVLPKADASKTENLQLEQLLSQDVKDLLTAIQQMNAQQCSEIVKILHDANSVYIFGVNEALPVAFSTYYELSQVRNNVHMIQNDATNIALDTLQMDDESALLIVNLENQNETLTEVAEMVKRKKSTVITITNKPCIKLKKQSAIYIDVNKQGQLEDGTIVMHAIFKALTKCLKEQSTISSNLTSNEKLNKTINKLLIEVS